MALHFLDLDKRRNPEITLAAVVVSYNRAELVVKALEGINNGSVLPTHLIVVDNGSTDGSRGAIQNFFENRLKNGIKAELIELRSNVGGAGGFTVGIGRAAFKYKTDLIWVMDDDTEPLKDTAEHLVAPWRQYAPRMEFHPAFVASRVVWSDGRNHPMNTPRRRPYASKREIKRARKVNAMTVRSASFVSLLLDGRTVREQGLPIADYFLWNDDFEYSARLARFGAGIYAPRSIVKHHTKKFDSAVDDPGERFLWEVRNKIWMFRYSPALNPREKILYGAVSLFRWAKTIVRSQNKKPLLESLGQGLKKGILSAPRSNEAVLKEAYDLASFLPTAVDEPENPNFRIRDGFRGYGDRGSWKALADEEDNKFSVLISYYENDTVERLFRALQSVTTAQRVPPAEIVLVQDGKVSPELERFVKQYKKDSKIPVKIGVLKKNGGLAKALDYGLEKTSYGIVARMDSDDVSLPRRFEEQLGLMRQGYDLVGSDVIEFMTDLQGNEIDLAIRRMPYKRKDIIKASHFKSPFNHPTVMYRKSAVERAGGYQALRMMEDYWLFVRMIASGARIANIPKPLLKYRVDGGAYKRRGGVKMLWTEIRLQHKLLVEGYSTPWLFLRNIVVRGGYRIAPERIRKRLYAAFFVHRKGEKG